MANIKEQDLEIKEILNDTDDIRVLDEAGNYRIKVADFKDATDITSTKNKVDSHVVDKANPHSVTKAQVGLGNVDNTSDASKPISTATQAALDAKANTADLTTHTSSTSNPHSVTKAQVGLGSVDNTSDISKPISSATQAALDAKADKTQVLTNVPANAKFTDTVTTINGKTGTIAKSDIVALGIPAQDTVVDISGKVDKVAGKGLSTEDYTTAEKTKLSGIDTGAIHTHTNKAVLDKFTEVSGEVLYNNQPISGGIPAYGVATPSADGLMSSADKSKLDGVAAGANNYVHPGSGTNPHGTTKADVGLGNVDNTSDASKPISTATQTALNAKADKTQVLTNVPANAKFTDTITTKTSELTNDSGFLTSVTKSDVGLSNVDNTSDANKPISTATQTALNSKANATDLTTHTGSTSNPHSVTKAQIGLSNVDNVKQMPISGGVLENYSEKLIVLSENLLYVDIDLSLGSVFYQKTARPNSYDYYFTNTPSEQASSFTLILESTNSISRVYTFPASVKWQGGEIPDMSSDANKTYVLTFMTVDGGTTWLGMFGGEF